MNNRALKQRATSLFHAQDYTAACGLLSQCCEQTPGDIEAWYLFGVASAMLGHLGNAETACRRVLKLNPAIPGAYVNLVNVLLMTDRVPEAVDACLKGLECAPKNAQLKSLLGTIRWREGKIPEAISEFEAAIALDPDQAETQNNLGALLWEQRRFEEAAIYLQRALSLAPEYADAHANLGNVLTEMDRTDEAIHCYRKALQLRPELSKNHCNLGKALQTQGDDSAAMTCFDAAIRTNPADVEAIIAKCELLEVMNRADEGRELIAPLMKRKTPSAKAALAYAKLASDQQTRYQAIEYLESVLHGYVPPREQVDIHFALGDMYDGIEEYDSAFRHYRIGNEADSRPFDPEKAKFSVSNIMQSFCKQTLGSLPRAECDSEAPMFILGMPRSGTSLAEQILASHSDVHGGGELDWLCSITGRLPALLGSSQPYPGCIRLLTAQAINTCAHEHLDRLRTLAPQAQRISDKTPMNFLDIGLITLLFPKARIVHCRRDARDNCLSIYFHRFNAHHAYATDLRSLGLFYGLYEQLMQYWENVLTTEIFRMGYEETVAKPEDMTRDLIAFVGLEWQEACLRFYDSRRIVHTPSYKQVRQPIYSRSVWRWKHYEQHLDPLLEALARPLKI